MRKQYSDLVKCELSGEMVPREFAISASLLSPLLLQSLHESRPDCNDRGYVSLLHVNKLLSKQVHSKLREEIDKLSSAAKDPYPSKISEGSLLTSNLGLDYNVHVSNGGLLATNIAKIVGTWGFVISITLMTILRILADVEIISLATSSYALINIGLAIAGIILGPIIIIGQNRGQRVDALRDRNNYLINLKSEMELRFLSEKITTLFHVLQNQAQDSGKGSELSASLSTKIEHPVLLSKENSTSLPF